MAKERKDKHFLNKPTYDGGQAALKKFITQHLVYPESAQASGVEGTVVLRYSINHKGVVTGAKVIASIGYGCDEEAIRLVKLLKFKVAKNRGVKATFHKTIKIHFRKPKPKTTPPPAPSIQYAYIPNQTKKVVVTEAKPIPVKKTISYNYIINLNPSADQDTSE